MLLKEATNTKQQYSSSSNITEFKITGNNVRVKY